jgi:protein gp37
MTQRLWMGVSVEHMRTVERIEHLRQVPAAVRFLSCEPLIGPLENLDLSGIHWVIVGGESGPRARPMDPSWAQSLLVQCRAVEVPFFFKQWGGVRKKATGRVLNGQTYDEFPRVSSGIAARLHADAA